MAGLSKGRRGVKLSIKETRSSRSCHRGVKMPIKKTKSSRAGLIMPVARFHRFLRKGRYAKKIGAGASVYMAATVEYLVTEVLEGAFIEAKNSKKSVITPRHINQSIRKDDELKQWFRNVVMPQGGVVPYIHEKLLIKKSKK